MTDDANHEPRIRLVTRGDDAGVVPEANAAIRDAFLEGIMRNASVMAPAPAIEDAADRLADLDDLCIGLHLTLTAEWDHPRWGPIRPAEEVPSLLDDDGRFPRTVEELEGTIALDEAMTEARAQLRRLRDLGFEVSYLDTHMLASRIDELDDHLATCCEREGLIYADRDVEAFLPGYREGSPAELLADELSARGPGTYALVAHPCYDEGEAREIRGRGHEAGEVAKDRDRQRRVFTDPGVPDVLEDAGAEPVRYAD